METDLQRLNQILKNLLSNSFKFTEKGEVKLRIYEAHKSWKQGNTNLDAAKIHYSWALKVLQNKLTNVEHHKATALSNIGLIEFIEGL